MEKRTAFGTILPVLCVSLLPACIAPTRESRRELQSEEEPPLYYAECEVRSAGLGASGELTSHPNIEIVLDAEDTLELETANFIPVVSADGSTSVRYYIEASNTTDGTLCPGVPLATSGELAASATVSAPGTIIGPQEFSSPCASSGERLIFSGYAMDWTETDLQSERTFRIELSPDVIDDPMHEDLRPSVADLETVTGESGFEVRGLVSCSAETANVVVTVWGRNAEGLIFSGVSTPIEHGWALQAGSDHPFSLERIGCEPNELVVTTTWSR